MLIQLKNPTGISEQFVKEGHIHVWAGMLGPATEGG